MSKVYDNMNASKEIDDSIKEKRMRKMLKIYVENVNSLKGKWIEFPIDEDEFNEVLEEIGGAEYNYIFRYFEYNYITSRDISEWTSFDEANELAEIEEEAEVNNELKALIEYCNSAVDGYDFYKNNSYYFYDGMSLEDVARELANEQGLADWAEFYFDYEAFAHDLACGGYEDTSFGVLDMNR